uniref:Uncharacterized protein n=1 Tax=Anopheles atroparvus TaxID=41427 RepID=A0A182JK55_ANOAO
MAVDVQQGRIESGGVVGLAGGQHRAVGTVLSHQHLHRDALGRAEQGRLVLLDLLPLGLVAAVLEPDLHLRLREPQVLGQLGPLRSGQVALLGEAPLQLEHLRVAEGRPGALFPGGRHFLARSHQLTRRATVEPPVSIGEPRCNGPSASPSARPDSGDTMKQSNDPRRSPTRGNAAGGGPEPPPPPPLLLILPRRFGVDWRRKRFLKTADDDDDGAGAGGDEDRGEERAHGGAEDDDDDGKEDSERDDDACEAECEGRRGKDAKGHVLKMEPTRKRGSLVLRLCASALPLGALGLAWSLSHTFLKRMPQKPQAKQIHKSNTFRAAISISVYYPRTVRAANDAGERFAFRRGQVALLAEATLELQHLALGEEDARLPLRPQLAVLAQLAAGRGDELSDPTGLATELRTGLEAALAVIPVVL